MEIKCTVQTVSEPQEKVVYEVDGHEFNSPRGAERYIRRVWHDTLFSDIKRTESRLTIYDENQYWYYCTRPEHILAAAHHHGNEFKQHNEVGTYHYPSWYAFSCFDHDNGTSVWCSSLAELRADLQEAIDFMDRLEV